MSENEPKKGEPAPADPPAPPKTAPGGDEKASAAKKIKTKESAKKQKIAKKEPHCPYCSGKLRLVELYDEYYCDKCTQYVHRHLLGIPQKTRIMLICPTCKGEPEYIYEYSKHYCHLCKRYLSVSEMERRSVALEVERAPVPPPAEFYLQPPPLMQAKGYLCKKCNNELQFIYQYQRWYCYECGEYI